jgi:Lysylphosphatidylglycerol synthase TM region
VQLNKNIKLILNYFLGPIVFLLLSFSIYRQLIKQPDWHESWREVKNALSDNQQWKLITVVLLMLLNWGLEAKKWQLAIRPLQSIPFRRAFLATLTGTCMACFTPNRMGEYLGRILYIEEGKRISSISLTIVCSIGQLIVTLFFGCAGILYLQQHIQGFHVPSQHSLYIWLNVLLSGGLVVLLMLSVFYFRLSWLIKLLKKVSLPASFFSAVKVLEEFNATILLRILFLSFVRYLVFIAQYYLLFSVFGVSLSLMETAAGMSVVFLVLAVIPTFTFLTELGLRWEAAIQVMALFSANTTGIFATSFGIWLINLIIPALAGSLLILNIKLFRNK